MQLFVPQKHTVRLPFSREKSHAELLEGIKKGKTQALTSEEIRASRDFEYFRLFVCGHETFPHQRQWINYLITNRSLGKLKLIAGEDTTILSPRGSSKSTVIIEFLAWYIGFVGLYFRTNIKIIYVCYQPKLAATKSRQIKAIIESSVYQKIFPNVRSGEKWNELEWCIDLERVGEIASTEPYTFLCAGMMTGIVGSRANIIIFDDIIKNRDEAEKKEIQDKMESNYQSAIKHIRLPESRVICLGTLFAKRDIMSRVFLKSDKWKILKQSALVRVINDGVEQWKSYWEPRFPGDFGYSTESLLEEMNSDSPLERQAFLLQRQNEYPDLMVSGFNPDWIKTAFIPNDRIKRLYIGADCATSSSSTSDDTSLTIGGITQQNNIFILENHTAKLPSGFEKIDAMHALYSKWKSICSTSELVIGVDANRYSITVEKDFDYVRGRTDLARALKVYDRAFLNCDIVRVPTSHRASDKLDRLLSHSTLFEGEKIYFNKTQMLENKGADTLKVLVDEILDYSPLNGNDRLDSLEVLLSSLQKDLSI